MRHHVVVEQFFELFGDALAAQSREILAIHICNRDFSLVSL
jgi:hypothetical protein